MSIQGSQQFRLGWGARHGDPLDRKNGGIFDSQFLRMACPIPQPSQNLCGRERNLDRVYTRLEPGTKLLRISLVFARGLMDPVRIGSAIWYIQFLKSVARLGMLNHQVPWSDHLTASAQP